MAGREQEEKIVQFDRLNVLGKAVFIGGMLSRAATHVVESAIKATAEIVIEAEKAFKQGLDSNIEEAKIIEEHEERQ
jgi:hypothetical protein